ncbi:MAG: RNA polymerase-associated protein RapA [Tatlockia sp.]|nr:RNA polymerase-associated protein RapA [Tatlockia sp.]
MTFFIGQRWISNSESQLGLGIISNLQHRQVSVSYPAAGEERIYSSENAPLTRIHFKINDEVFTLEQQKIHITEVREQDNLLIYTGTNEAGELVTVDELDLDCFIKLTTPKQRLFSGQLDKLPTFKLRIETLNKQAELQLSSVRGLLGSRTNHLSHQIYIANEVAKRYAPRVLLADEVGLGKTIEAGMILHYQLHTGRAERVLIVVPSSLIHQWLVEMRRRFNLYFSIIDQGYFERQQEELIDDEENLELEHSCAEDNFFEREQLVLCSLDFLLTNEKAKEQALSADWDLLIVDEAHHLHWSESGASQEYQLIEQLANKSKGLLELTATPEQVGIESHFARLRLLDPSRFYDFSTFKKEEEGYKALNDLVQKLIDYQKETQSDCLNPTLKKELENYLNTDTTLSITETIQQLLDRHGTGRVLFRNTRAAIQGFPERRLHSYPLPLPEIYKSLEEAEPLNLFPETTLNSEVWLQSDPRVSWLINKLKELHPEKVLVICSQASTAMALDEHLKLQEGIRCASFHEGLSIIERDRFAAYFSEKEKGAQTLICSEIGSEGRNFQFSHHLVLFDLPLNPDLLEQRIGRLDRIGQLYPIEIHSPYLQTSAQERLFRWHNEGLNLFEKSCSVAFSIYEKFEDRLMPLLINPNSNQNDFEQMIADVQVYTKQLLLRLSEGRDRLLELNSCNSELANELISAIEATENVMELENYMAAVFQEYGIEHEYHSEFTEILRPTTHMKSAHFPGLKEDGVTVTYSRSKALVREDMEFISWEHPMVCESMDMILDSELGNVSMVTISVKGLLPGTLLLETFYTLNCAAPKFLQLNRFLPLKPIRILNELSGKNLSKVLSYDQLNGLCAQLNRHKGPAIIKNAHQDLETMLEASKNLAEQQRDDLLKNAKDQMKKSIEEEVNRLKALQKINPAIRDDEILFFQKQIEASEHFINHAELKLQALRVVINK